MMRITRVEPFYVDWRSTCTGMTMRRWPATRLRICGRLLATPEG